jgi:hypothetical protein
MREDQPWIPGSTIGSMSPYSSSSFGKPSLTAESTHIKRAETYPKQRAGILERFELWVTRLSTASPFVVATVPENSEAKEHLDCIRIQRNERLRWVGIHYIQSKREVEDGHEEELEAKAGRHHIIPLAAAWGNSEQLDRLSCVIWCSLDGLDNHRCLLWLGAGRRHSNLCPIQSRL